jgi:5-methylcytosine-specific restriction endonuclease McrA
VNRSSVKKMSATDKFQSNSVFVERLRSLRQARREHKLELCNRVFREPLSNLEREEVFAKTGGRCHICGGLIEGKWEADHVFSHFLGGKHSIDNYLPAHPICNGYRWFYEPEEFQWILKLGVWLRTHIETETKLGRLAVAAFLVHERIRASRRKKQNTESRPTTTDAR